MTVLTPTATVRRNDKPILGQGAGGDIKVFGTRTVELAAAASSSLIDFALEIPSNMRISGNSRIYNDDLATSGSATLDLGLYPVNSNITAVEDAFIEGMALSTASTTALGALVVADHANFGKQAWEFLGGSVTADPGGTFKVKGVVRDAATTATGTITLEMYGYLD